jgi:hypothetical protein
MGERQCSAGVKEKTMVAMIYNDGCVADDINSSTDVEA